MIKRVLYKIFSALLAVIVLFSTVSFTIEKHFCGDVLVSVSVFTEAEKCAMESYEQALEVVTKIPCCKDEVNLFAGQDELKSPSFEDLELSQQLILAAFTYAYFDLFISLPKQIIPHKDYSPPNLVADIQVLQQIFII